MKIIATICAFLVMAPASFSEESFYCGSWVASTDMSVAELLKKCGQPASKEVSTKDILNDHRVKVGTITIETWRYDRGPTATPMLVTIVDGKIQDMRRGQ